MQAYYDKITYTPFYLEHTHSSSPILRGYQDKNRRKKPVSSGYRPIYNNSRLHFSINRAKKRLRFTIASNISLSHDLAFWSYTFDPKFDKIAKNEVLAREYFRQFMKRMRRISNIDLRYIAIAEKQKKSGRNAWHFHVLFFNLPFYPHENMEAIWKAGFVFVTSKRTDIKSIQHLISYMSKYLSKDTDVGRSKKLFWTSRNLDKPTVLYDKHFDLSSWKLYSSNEVVALGKTTFILKNYFHANATTNKSTTIGAHRKVYLQ